MTIEVSEEDVEKVLRTVGWPLLPGNTWNIRVALERFVELHPELAPKRAMHEPVTEEEAEQAARIWLQPPKGGAGWCEEGYARRMLTDFLGRRAVPEPRQVVVTEEMRQQCAKASGWEGGAMSEVIWHAMNWLADHLNGKGEKPVDPRVGIVGEWLAGGFSTGEGTDADIRNLLAKLDEAKAQQA